MKFDDPGEDAGGSLSPSVRRAWIEILVCNCKRTGSRKSPSVRRAWIEIYTVRITYTPIRSPSVRRAWIEIHTRN